MDLGGFRHSISSISSFSSPTANVILEDYLDRLSVLKIWTSRYVVLTSDALSFHRKKGYAATALVNV